MKTLWWSVLLFEIVLIGTESLKSGHKIKILPDFMKKFKSKILKIKSKNQPLVRNLNDDINTTDIYDESDYLTEDIETDTITPTSSPTSQPNSTTAKTITLIDFGGFTISKKENEEDQKTKNTMSWNTYFKYYPGQPKPNLITFVIKIFIFFRRLQESNSNGYYINKTVNCNLADESHSLLQYKCDAELEEDEEEKVAVEKIEKITIVENTFTFDGEKVEAEDMEISASASAQMENLGEQKEDQLSVVIENKNAPFFNFNSGILRFDKLDNKFYISNLILNSEGRRRLSDTDGEKVEGNYNFKFQNFMKGNVEEDVPCSLGKSTDEQINIYDLECAPKRMPFSSNVDHGIGYGIENKNNIIMIDLAGDQNPNVTIGDSKSSKYFRKTSSGLSGGAIAGIVIVCIVAFVAISILIIMLKRKKTSDLPMNSTNQNFNFPYESNTNLR